MPDEAKAAGAYVYGSGRSDLENQINNSLVFPGIFKAIMQHSLKEITENMKIKAAEAIAECIVGPPRRDYIIPDSLDKDVAIKISEALKPKWSCTDEILLLISAGFLFVFFGFLVDEIKHFWEFFPINNFPLFHLLFLNWKSTHVHHQDLILIGHEALCILIVEPIEGIYPILHNFLQFVVGEDADAVRGSEEGVSDCNLCEVFEGLFFVKMMFEWIFKYMSWHLDPGC